MFPPRLLPTVFEKKFHRILVIDNTTLKMFIKRLTSQLLEDRFEVVLVTDHEHTLSDICQQNREWCITNETENGFTGYLSSWLEFEYILRIHKIESIIQVIDKRDFSTPDIYSEKFKFASRFGVSKFILSIYDDKNEKHNNSDNSGDSEDSDNSVDSCATYTVKKMSRSEDDFSEDENKDIDVKNEHDDEHDEDEDEKKEDVVILKFGLSTNEDIEDIDDDIEDVVNLHIHFLD